MADVGNDLPPPQSLSGRVARATNEVGSFSVLFELQFFRVTVSLYADETLEVQCQLPATEL